MSEHVTVEHGHYLRIDTHGWIAQRVGGEHTDLSVALGDWGRLERDTGYPSRDWITRAQLWCTAREYVICEGFPVLHDHPRLSNEVSVLLAHAGDLGPVAIVSIDGHPPTVYADVTTDEGYWHQIDTVDIVCPHGHRWTWSDTELVTPEGTTASVAAVFGDQPHTPFTPCPDCLADDNDETDTLCPFPGADIIACPVCGQRCDLELTAVPTVPQRRAYAVHVSEAVEYQGWVLATDADDADDEARRLLADGGTATGRGHLEPVRLDREVMANDAAEMCWQCRTDPRQPNPACPHPPPGHGRPVEAAQAAAAHTAPVMSVDTAAVPRR